MAVTTGEDGHVFEHRLATIAEARGFHGTHIERATQAVDNQGRQGFAFDVFSDDQQRLATVDDGFQTREPDP